MYEYTGPEYGTQGVPDLLEDWELEDHVRRLVTTKTIIGMDEHPLPYFTINRPIRVSNWKT